MPLPVPGNVEATAVHYVASGAMALRRRLADLEPHRCLQRLVAELRRLDDAQKALEKLPAKRLELHLATTPLGGER